LAGGVRVWEVGAGLVILRRCNTADTVDDADAGRPAAYAPPVIAARAATAANTESRSLRVATGIDRLR
jgi:hypothetical protein